MFEFPCPDRSNKAHERLCLMSQFYFPSKKSALLRALTLLFFVVVVVCSVVAAGAAVGFPAKLWLPSATKLSISRPVAPDFLVVLVTAGLAGLAVLVVSGCVLAAT